MYEVLITVEHIQENNERLSINEIKKWDCNNEYLDLNGTLKYPEIPLRFYPPYKGCVLFNNYYDTDKPRTKRQYIYLYPETIATVEIIKIYDTHKRLKQITTTEIENVINDRINFYGENSIYCDYSAITGDVLHI